LVYIRRKKVKGIDYAYIVKSEWDQTTRTSRQKTIKYLGKASKVTEEMIPIEYRNDPPIISFITRYSNVDKKKNEIMTAKLRREVLRMLSYSDLKGLLEIYDSYINLFGMVQFYENLLKPVMYSVGRLWAEKRIDVATEHLCVNSANTLIKIINEKQPKRVTNCHNKGKIFICTPNGEQHNLACNIIESVLLSKGYKVYNASPSLPTESVINALNHILPDAILISVTLKEHLQTTKNLIRKIKAKFSLPIFVGGIALNDANNTSDFETVGAIIIRNIPITDLVKLIKSTSMPTHV
jgi:methanogenic corrinoid protein MtbC1